MIRISILLTLPFVCYSVGTDSSSSVCGFSGQCVYNLKVHHCKSQSRRSVPSVLGQDDCLCLDIQRARSEIVTLTKWATSTRNVINKLANEYNSTKQELDRKSALLKSAQNEVQQRNMSLQMVESKRIKLENQILAENLNWSQEKAILQEELKKVIKDTQTCKAAQAAVTKPPLTDGGATTRPRYSVTFCDFDSNNMCIFTQDTSDNADFKSGRGTLFTSTGPQMDHTYGNPHGSYYYIDAKNMASSSRRTYTARIKSKLFPPSSGYCIMFWYNAHGKDTKDLNVYAEVGNGLGNPVFKHSGPLDSSWHLAKISLDSEYTSSSFRVVFEATAEPYKTYHYSGKKRSYYTFYKTDGNVAIDDIYVYNTSCSVLNTYPSNSVRHDDQTSRKTSYYVINEDPKTWYDAKVACKELGPMSHLVSINSADEQAFIVNLIKGSTASRLGFYTSGNDERQENVFDWTDTGSPYQTIYTNWHPGQPNNVGSNQDCLLLEYPDDNWTWGDVTCSDKHPYICEINDTF